MKLILSRKGFDSQYGGIPSPILPDGRLVPLSIPSLHDPYTFDDLNMQELDLDKLLKDLSNGAYSTNFNIHLDPDLNRPISMRLPDWRPSLGQTGAAQSHLASNDVGEGDVFLFFGWFRQVESVNGTWRYMRSAPNMHVIFGWMEIDDVLPIVEEREQSISRYPWIANHPHVSNPEYYNHPLNTLYIASKYSKFRSEEAFGGGRFSHYSESLRL